MGAKDWMLFYSEGDVRSVLKAAPPIDRAATRGFVERLYPGHRLVDIEDGTLGRNANPADGYVYAGCFPGLSIVCTGDVALDRPSRLDQRFVDEAKAEPCTCMRCIASWITSRSRCGPAMGSCGGH